MTVKCDYVGEVCMNKSVTFGRLSLLVLVVIVLASCNQVSTQPVAAPKGLYSDVAWLDTDRIAFLYTSVPNPKPWDDQVLVFNLNSNQYEIVAKPDEECFVSQVLYLNRLPDGRLGFVFECSKGDRRTIVGDMGSLYIWNDATLENWYQYQLDFHAADYTFSPDLGQAIQETSDDKLYRVIPDQSPQRIFSDWAQVELPSWSPDGNTIAFVGLQTIPDISFNPFSFTPVESQYLSNLYLMDANGDNVRSVLSDIKRVACVKWSPLGRLLSFRGEYQGKLGVWILDTQTNNLQRIRENANCYDWSPDGTKMVIIETVSQENYVTTESRPVIINLPEELENNLK